MRVLWIAVVAVVAAAACSDEPVESPPPAAALEGAYYSPDGSEVWSAYQGRSYVTWSSDPACNDGSSAPPAWCEHRGTFVLDATRETLTMTDAATGEVRVRGIRIEGTESRGSLLGDSTGTTSPRSLGIVGSSSELTQTTSSPTVASRVKINENRGTQVVDWKETVHACLLAIKLLTGSDPGSTDLSKLRPPAMPAPIVSTSTSCPPKKG